MERLGAWSVSVSGEITRLTGLGEGGGGCTNNYIIGGGGGVNQQLHYILLTNS